MKTEYLLKRTGKFVAALFIFLTTALLSDAGVYTMDRYQAYYGDSVAVEVSTTLVEKEGEYVINRISLPKSAVAKMVADQISEDSYVDAGEGYFRTREYHYSELGKEPIKSIVGDDNIVRISNGKEFKLADDDIVIDMGSIQYVFKFMALSELANRRVKVVTHKRVDVYEFSDFSEVSIKLGSQNKEIRAMNIKAHDVNRPGRFSEFWLNPEDNMRMLKMVQQSEKKRVLLPNSMTLKLM